MDGNDDRLGSSSTQKGWRCGDRKARRREKIKRNFHPSTAFEIRQNRLKTRLQHLHHIRVGEPRRAHAHSARSSYWNAKIWHVQLFAESPTYGVCSTTQKGPRKPSGSSPAWYSRNDTGKKITPKQARMNRSSLQAAGVVYVHAIRGGLTRLTSCQ